jgi:hypothetical protein
VKSDADPGFHFDADPVPDPDPNWHQNDVDPHADPSFLVNGKGVTILSILTAY